jgi:hypothetical protein
MPTYIFSGWSDLLNLKAPPLPDIFLKTAPTGFAFITAPVAAKYVLI